VCSSDLTKEKNIIDIPSANICTDFGFHSFWYNKDVNYYFVAVEEIKKRFVSRGVKSSAIIVTGIPIKSKFTKICNREQIIDKLNLNKSHPVLLIIGGKMGYGNLREILYNIKEKDKNAQFIIVSGRDARLKERLEESEYKNDPTVKIFGFADNLEELMTAADLILTKAGGITVAECLAKNLPMIINDVIPGQEEDNVRYVVLNKAGFKVKNERKCAEIIADLFLDSRKMERLRKNCKKIAKPDAADMLVDFVASKLD
jgi:processive 1,2-diacylglycerol beta-glucosyltransferase